MEQANILQISLDLIRQIEESFSGVCLPPPEKIGGPNTEFDMEDFVNEYESYHDDWRKIPEDMMLLNTDCLTFSTKESYPFFIAAYITLALKKIQEYDQTFLMYVLYDLCWTAGNEKYHDNHREKQSLLSKEQRQVIKKFLELVNQYTDDDEFLRLTKQTLDSGIYD